ncbi:MAG: hypothetical protein ACRD2L_26005, partial [Terriglobia bacterium]
RGLSYLRITEYSDDTLRLSKHSIDFRSPRPSAGEGLGMRGLEPLECSRHGSEIPILHWF